MVTQNVKLETLLENQSEEWTETKFRRALEAQGYSVATYAYPPGTYFPPHTHRADKIEVCLSGRFMLKMGDTEVVLMPGEALAVPGGTVHAAEALGGETVLTLDAVRHESQRL